jgi:hypothetical protein
MRQQPVSEALPLDGPDLECVPGHGAEALKMADPAAAPRPALDHSHRGPGRARAAVGRQPGGQRRPAPVPVPVPVTIGRPSGPAASPGQRRESAGWLRSRVARDGHGQEPASGRPPDQVSPLTEHNRKESWTGSGF